MTKQSYAYIVNKMRERVSTWNARNISMAGRITLSQAVLSVMPNYMMQTSFFPVATCSEIDKIRRNYIWNGKVEKGKVHLVSWEKVCMEKVQGGSWGPPS